jgi:hypothetical protein
MPQLFGLAQSRSSSLRFTAIVSLRQNYSFILLRPTPRNLARWPEHGDGGKST